MATDPVVAAALAQVQADLAKLQTDTAALATAINAPPPPPPPPPPPAPALRIAIMDVGARNYIPGLVDRVKGAGVTWDRLDVGDGKDLTQLKANLALGIKSLVLYNPGLAGRNPAQCAAEVKALAQRIVPLGLNEIEFGNEVYYNGSTPQSYEAQYAAAHAAIAGMGVTLIANSYGDYERADGSWSQDAAGGGWIHDFLAVGLGPDAWSSHPYGSMTGVQGGDSGWAAVANHRKYAMQYGSSAPWYITEVGQQTGSATPTPAQLAQQAADVTQYLNDLVNVDTFVVYWCWYEIVDDGTGKWGLLNSDASPRPSFNALAAWMAANASKVSG